MPKPTVSTTFNAVDKLTAPVNKMQKRISGFAKFVGGVFVTGAAARGIGYFVEQASKIEDAVAGFTPLMGSMEKADDLVKALNQTAATTPFQFEDIAASAKQLLPVMNGNIEKTIETFRMLGDTAGGNAQKLDSITRGFMKSMLKGKVDMESLNMIAEAGVPIYSELAESMGVSVAEMMQMSSAGKITADDLDKAFRKMTQDGGVFYRGMEIASKTQSGMFSTLKDNISLTAAELGKNLLPTTKMLTSQAIAIAGRIREWVSANSELINQKIKDVIDGITNAVRFLTDQWNNGTIPALLKAVAVFKAVTMAITGAQGLLVAIKAVKAAMAAGSLMSMINPVTAIAAAIAGAAFLIIKYWEPIKGFFQGLWGGVVGIFESAKNKIVSIADKILSPVRAVRDFIGGLGAESTQESRDYYSSLGAGRPEMRGLVSANQGMTESRSISESRSTVDVNIGGLPQGSTVRQRGVAPGVNLNYGYLGG